MLANPAAITQQQARLLLPLLQQIASSGTPGPSCESPSGSSGSSFGSSNSSPLFYPTPPRIPVAGTGSGQVGGYSTDESEGAGRYSSDELFQSKKKNSKSSSAHSYCHTIIREAAKASGLWDSAPLLEEISPETLKKFRETAYSLCPVLKSDPAKLKKLLGESMMNRRAYLRRIKRKSPPAKRYDTPKYRYGRKGAKTTAKNLFAPHIQSDEGKMPEELSILRPGTGVIVRDSNATIIGKGMFMNKENEMYGQVILQENMSKKKDTINLPKTVGKKCTFQQLKMNAMQKNDVFQWKMCYLTADFIERESEEDSSSDEGALSAMEEKRLASIKRNEIVWDEIGKGNISMDEEGELLFSESAEHLMDYEPLIEDDRGRKQKLSPKRALPDESTTSLRKSGPSPKKATKKPGTTSKKPSSNLKQSPSKKRKTLPPVASPKKKAPPSKKKGTKESPSKKSESPLRKNARKCTSKNQVQASDSSSSECKGVEKHTKESKYWTYISESEDESPEPAPNLIMGRGKRQRKIKIRSDDDIM